MTYKQVFMCDQCGTEAVLHALPEERPLPDEWFRISFVGHPLRYFCTWRCVQVYAEAAYAEGRA